MAALNFSRQDVSYDTMLPVDDILRHRATDADGNCAVPEGLSDTLGEILNSDGRFVLGAAAVTLECMRSFCWFVAVIVI